MTLEKKYVGEKKDGPKCFNCGGAAHFIKECKSKMVDTNEDYQVRYKKFFASLKRYNIDVKILVFEVENLVDNEESSYED